MDKDGRLLSANQSVGESNVTELVNTPLVLSLGKTEIRGASLEELTFSASTPEIALLKFLTNF